MNNQTKKHLLIYALFGPVTKKYHYTLYATLTCLSRYTNISPVVICDSTAKNFLQEKKSNCIIIELTDVKNHSRFTEIKRINNLYDYDTISFRDADSSFTAEDIEIIDTFSHQNRDSILAIRDSRYHVWPLMAGLTTMDIGLYNKFEIFIMNYKFEKNWFSDQICLAHFYEQLINDNTIYHWGRGIRYSLELPLIKEKRKRMDIFGKYSGFWGMPLHNPEPELAYNMSTFPIPTWFAKKNRFLIFLKLNIWYNKIMRNLRYER